MCVFWGRNLWRHEIVSRFCFSLLPLGMWLLGRNYLVRMVRAKTVSWIQLSHVNTRKTNVCHQQKMSTSYFCSPNQSINNLEAFIDIVTFFQKFHISVIFSIFMLAYCCINTFQWTSILLANLENFLLFHPYIEVPSVRTTFLYCKLLFGRLIELVKHYLPFQVQWLSRLMTFLKHCWVQIQNGFQ